MLENAKKASSVPFRRAIFRSRCLSSCAEDAPEMNTDLYAPHASVVSPARVCLVISVYATETNIQHTAWRWWLLLVVERQQNVERGVRCASRAGVSWTLLANSDAVSLSMFYYYIATLPLDYAKLQNYNVKICSANYKVQKCAIQYRVYKIHNIRYNIQISGNKIR